MNLMIELTNWCTLRCPTCFSHQDSRVKLNMSFKQFKHIIDHNIGLINSISLYNYGEPFLNKNLPEMIFYAKKKGVHFTKVATNGMHFSSSNINKILKSKLDYLSISIDGATQDTYGKFRVGGEFKKVISGANHLVKTRNALGSNLKIEIQFILMKHNEHEVKRMEVLAQKLGVDYLRLKTVLIKKNQWSYLLPKTSRYSRYEDVPLRNTCYKAVDELVINCDGTVIPCCYIVGEDIKKFQVGNIFKQSLKEILNSPQYLGFVKQCTTDKSKLSSCAECNEGNQPLDYKVVPITKAEHLDQKKLMSGV